MWDNTQFVSGRVGNKQKTRQTKRIPIAPCNSMENVKEESVCRLDVDDEVIAKHPTFQSIKGEMT
jgi:hypothetical protein